MNLNDNKESSSCDINAKSCSCSTEENIEIDLKTHWNDAYKKSESKKLGWYESYPEPSLQLIKKCNLNKNASLLNVGVGATTLIDELINLDYKNIIASDLSLTALEIIKNRVGENKNKVKWIVDDLINSKILINNESVDLWHDRAVLHFFNEKVEQDAYFKLLNKLVKKGGFVIIAAFNLNGATKCSGLPVFRYDEKMLVEKMGYNFELIESFDFSYQMPSGDLREYIYTLFKRNI